MIKLDYQALAHGLDEASGFSNPKAGRLIGCQNFELVFGDMGLRRINGYEAFDGRSAPSSALLSAIGFDTGTAAINAGDTVTTPSGSAYVVRVSITSGTWGGGDAAGLLFVTGVTGTISAAQALSVGTPKATATSFSVASVDDATYAADIAGARNYYRGLIQQPVGDGAILGVAVWNGTVLCLRNVVGSATATLWRSSAAGWVAVRTGLRPGGSMRGIVANFTGASASQAFYAVDGKNRLIQVSQAWAVTYAGAIFQTEGTSTTSVTPGSGSKAFTTTETGRSWTIGQEVIAYSAANAANFMIGSVTASGGSSVTVNVTSFGGVAATDWHICRTDGQDRATVLAEHKSYMMLGYPQGQLQGSNVGDPIAYGSGDAFGIGDDITDLLGMRGDVLGVFTANGISLLYGDGSTGKPWEMKRHTSSNGAKTRSVQEVGGDGLFVSPAGLSTIVGTQTFGDFGGANIGMEAHRTQRDVVRDFRCTAISRLAVQYRMYGAAGQVLVMTLYGAPAPENVRFTKLRYLHQPTVAASAMLQDGSEMIVFGTQDGWVMRDRIGTTFNGASIEAFFRTSYWHAKQPQQRKRWRKLILDVETGLSAVALSFRQDIDFNGPDQSEAYTYTANPGGGYFDLSYFDEFFWDGEGSAQMHASIDGIGRHMSLIVVSDGDTEPYIVRGMHSQYSPLGLQR